MPTLDRLTPCLWFDTRAEEAARFYVRAFDQAGLPDNAIDAISRHSTESAAHAGCAAGTALTVAFRLAGRSVTALNGGPRFRFTEAVSLQVFCDTQAQLDALWSALVDGGEPSRCGWLQDRYGLSWQVVPARLPAMMSDPEPARVARVAAALMPMSKLDLDALERAYRGE